MKPEVMLLAEELKIPELEVVGHLVVFWTWVDQNMSPNCPVVIGTKKGLDRAACRDGFVDAMVKVGWLSFENGQIKVPNYDYHLSKSAKSRGVESKKKQRQRGKNKPKSDEKNSPDNVPENVPAQSGQDRDQRREEKSIKRNSKKKDSSHPLFDSWYSIYPKKVGRANAESSFVQAVSRICADQSLSDVDAVAWLVERTKLWLPNLLSCEPQYIPYPATWLNSRDYLDLPTVSQPKPEPKHDSRPSLEVLLARGRA